MKKKIKHVILIAFVLFVSIANSNAQNVNGSFEIWEDVEQNGFTNHIPKGWMETLNASCEVEKKPWAVTKTNDAHSGSLAIQLKNIGLSYAQPTMLMSSNGNPLSYNNKFPVDARYSSLKGFYKYATLSTDTFTINIFMMKGEDLIGIGEYKQSSNTSHYAEMNIPILYILPGNMEPDSAVIFISAGSSEQFKEGSTLLLDDLTFGQQTGLSDTESHFDAHIDIWPNPSEDGVVHITTKGAEGTVTIEIINILGESLQVESFETCSEVCETSVNLGAANKGILFVRVGDKKGSKIVKLIYK